MMNFPLLERDGRLLFFDDVGSFKREEQPSTLERRDFQRVVNITAEIKDNSVLQGSDFMASLRSWHDNNGQRYPGVVFSFGGESESTARSYRSLFSAFMISLFAIYGILAVQFKSYTQPFLIMANIVFSFTGVVLMTGLLGALNLVLPTGLIAAERAMITVNSFIAIVGLTGLVVNDAIVLIDFINQERQRGSSLGEAVRNGAHQRVRPIIMTTWSTIAGLLPLAIGIPDFSISWGPFATCFVAGLSVSTVMTLLIIPLLYEMLESLKAKAKP
jgi:HAE1 family hydrophobic/amphiphilic exporter-1